MRAPVFFWMAEDCGLSHGGVSVAPGTTIQDFRASWINAIQEAHRLNTNVRTDLLFHDLRRSAVRDMIRAHVPQKVAMEISGHKTISIFNRYNIVDERDKAEAITRTEQYRDEQRAKVVAINPGR